MFALDRFSRALLAAGAFGAFGAAFVTTPIVARGAAGAGVTGPALVTPLPARTAFAVVLPRRDPFAGGDAPSAHSSAPMLQPPAALPVPAVATLPQIPATLRPLPPNAGAGTSEFPFASGARVTAVVTGRHPFALVDEAGTTRVLTLGDRIGDAAIIAIDVDGVGLAGGAKLPIAHPIHGGR